jgi:hypothetical protein
MQVITPPGVPSMSTWGSIYRGNHGVTVTMSIMPPYNHYVLILHSHGSLWSFSIYKYFCARPIQTRHVSLIGTASSKDLRQLAIFDMTFGVSRRVIGPSLGSKPPTMCEMVPSYKNVGGMLIIMLYAKVKMRGGALLGNSLLPSSYTPNKSFMELILT